ncbi:hypothetical protein Q9295_04630 [Xinfangfangia sp. CPCC 101601]|uniref:Uncharacterized protein n=1 Tax=Pseudogemmobacter lacusdianii TaxID=3069608 RepID=A0ABU0VV79_9RHOB|nr:hypothetical protein [Xinfangfangia sp. CPCC 101601]MDQ2065647.1 hypothetical protein [Xinfangfangia sp. CPCC 101601]
MRSTELEALRMDSQCLASYGFGSDAQIFARKREIAALRAKASGG